MDNGGRLFFDGSCHGNMLVLGNGDPFFRGSRSFLNMGETSKKRPFFSSYDELIEEEFYDEQLPERKRRLTPEQVHLLETSFEEENKLEPERKTQLAMKLGMQPRQVAVWFQNRRARWKTKRIERDYEILKASYDSLLSAYDAMVKEKDKLKSEVLSLKEKVQAKEVAGMMVVCPNPADDDAEVAAIQLISMKAEDHLSTGSGGSAIVDEDGLQPVDSTGNSYFVSDGYGRCMGAMDGIQSEEEDGMGDNRCYFTDCYAEQQQQQQQQGESETLVWWVWS